MSHTYDICIERAFAMQRLASRRQVRKEEKRHQPFEIWYLMFWFCKSNYTGKVWQGQEVNQCYNAKFLDFLIFLSLETFFLGEKDCF